ncbi:DUF924 family protein [Paracoccus sp. 1_MG-2023]|uniref:DUF924 family protein n=1 Tax=unclassified Paracoccus (in: a-proteobacteria) TaxID=2688777 RepID=UPI001C0A3F97|nr:MULTISPECIES: DUF924 family protein [unclassified Paracoccus (in: a-proteobacteria)]MBU2956209.1 DUF924 domain-containing protein [Paracoccus sp. C2R09]MDO6667886.1 DUF924 family protein [Paracoccus sp. 1_MG-2023]
MPRTAKQVRDFWFSDRMRPWWFKKSDAVDAGIAADFGPTYDAARAGDLDHWRRAPDDALALAIVLDQFPRNMFRGSWRSFESNDHALSVAREALDQGFDMQVDPLQRQFFYLPFMHSEDLEDQDRSVALYEGLGNAHSLHFAREHRDIVARFGRFPHRNESLGRETTAQEAAFLEHHKGF